MNDERNANQPMSSAFSVGRFKEGRRKNFWSSTFASGKVVLSVGLSILFSV